VIVRTHDRPALLEQALTSLANQTRADFEVIVVNDGETPVGELLCRLESHLHLREVAGPRRGMAAANNAGLAAAMGRWIAYLDDDDIWYPRHLERLMAAIEGTGAQVAYTDAVRALCWSDLTHDAVVLRLPCVSLDFDASRLLVDNWIPNMAVLHAAVCLEDIGGHDETLAVFGDWDFLIRLAQREAFAHVAEATCEYR
jgi:glycosyltransferase involved in cell wall biosynthesis